jgi:hypothetical protein
MPNDETMLFYISEGAPDTQHINNTHNVFASDMTNWYI